MSHTMTVHDGRLQRRVSMHVRRDAAQHLSNGRVLYDALFTRTGYQTYPRADGSTSVEYRPASEVFREDSMATLGGLPGVLLHPSENFGTKFDGSYPVRGCTGDRVVVHTDKIHTAGTLCVWHDEWNAAIEQQTIAELSAGYTIKPGPGGTGPDGTHFDAMHTDIIGDHMAGVPAGNAGTARVLTDAIASMHPATRAALADIAAARMDAKPLYFDLGRWPAREKPLMDEQPQTPEPIPPAPDRADAFALALSVLDAVTPKAISDVFMEIYGSSEDPMMRKVCAALGSMPEAEGPKMDAAQAERFDAAVADAADRRADLIELHRRALGRDNAKTRTDGAPGKDGKPVEVPKTDAQIKREIIAKIDAARLRKVDKYTDAAEQRIALDQQLEECREKMDADAAAFPRLLEQIESTRKDGSAPTEITPEEKAMADAVRGRVADAGRVFGHTSTQAPASR